MIVVVGSSLGGNSGIEGPYELGIQSIIAVNDLDGVTENSRSFFLKTNLVTAHKHLYIADTEAIKSPADRAQAAKIELVTTSTNETR